MKTIEVVAAVICKDDKIFATQRGYGEWKDWWEFPGGEDRTGGDTEGCPETGDTRGTVNGYQRG